MTDFLVFDSETTGTDVFGDQIVQFYVGMYDKTGSRTDKWEWIINPGVPIPEEASSVHGFTDEYVALHGRHPEEALREILVLFSEYMDMPWVAYNLNFDLSILDNEFKRYGLDDHWGDTVAGYVRMFDPLVIDRDRDKYRKGKRTLEAVAKHYGVPFDPDLAHDAGYDVDVTAKVFLAVTAQYGYPSNATQARAHREWAEHLQEYLRDTNKDDTIVVDGSWPLRQKEESA